MHCPQSSHVFALKTGYSLSITEIAPVGHNETIIQFGLLSQAFLSSITLILSQCILNVLFIFIVLYGLYTTVQTLFFNFMLQGTLVMIPDVALENPGHIKGVLCKII